MRNVHFFNRGFQGASSFGRPMLPPAIRLLLIANGIVFVLQMLSGSTVARSFGLVPSMVGSGAFWQLFTYMFLHGGAMHLLMNMLVLWFLGRDLEYDWGSRPFMKFYLVCGVGAGLVTYLVQPTVSIPTIGASGAVFGVMLAFAMAYPNREITLLLFFVLPVTMKAKYLVAGLAVFQFLALGNGDGVAYITHIGGLSVAFVYLRFGGRKMRIPMPFSSFRQWRAKRKGRKLRQKWDQHSDLMESVDRVLDRINEVGYEHLTDEERETLKRASKSLSSEREKR